EEEQSGTALEDSKQVQAALPLELTWTAPPGCATADEIRRELGRIARARPGRTLPRVSADGRIERSGEAFRLTLHTVQSGVHGERSLVAKECRSLEREVTLVLALSFGEGVELVDDGDSTRSADPAANAEVPNNPASTSSPGTGASSTANATP